jgi:hypothetical protein
MHNGLSLSTSQHAIFSRLNNPFHQKHSSKPYQKLFFTLILIGNYEDTLNFPLTLAMISANCMLKLAPNT